jgi:hypothetical protein
MPAPIPFDAPVTIATLPLRSLIRILLIAGSIADVCCDLSTQEQIAD